MVFKAIFVFPDALLADLQNTVSGGSGYGSLNSTRGRQTPVSDGSLSKSQVQGSNTVSLMFSLVEVTKR